jgi:hypothetical protein
LVVKESTLGRHAGKGLFTINPIKKNQAIMTYTGVMRDNVPGYRATGYDIALHGGKLIDASDKLCSSIARYMNTIKAKDASKKCNAAIMTTDLGAFPNKCRLIRAIRDINGSNERPQEIFLQYGSGYQCGMGQ